MRWSVSAIDAASMARAAGNAGRGARPRHDGLAVQRHDLRAEAREEALGIPCVLAGQSRAEQGELELGGRLERPPHPVVVDGARAVQAERAGAVAQAGQQARADDVAADRREGFTGERLVEGEAAAGDEAGGHRTRLGEIARGEREEHALSFRLCPH